MNREETLRIARFDDLLKGYASLSHARQKRRAAFLEEATQVISIWRQRLFNSRRTDSPDFNVFAITFRSHFETTTHSTMLASLLDPMGSHEQGGLFLTAFLECLATKWPAKDRNHAKIPVADRHWRIHVEYVISKQRRIDILLHHPPTNYWLPIENKIYADDQENQLLDYWTWARNQGTGPADAFPIVYLTVEGLRPSNWSTGDDAQEKEKLLGDLVLMSYHTDVAGILRAVSRKIGSGRVRHTLDQYIQTVEAL